MITKSIQLTEQEDTALAIIAQQSDKTPDEVLHDAVEQFISQFQQTHRRDLLQQARGMWHDRTDLPTLDTRRRAWDRMEP